MAEKIFEAAIFMSDVTVWCAKKIDELSNIMKDRGDEISNGLAIWFVVKAILYYILCVICFGIGAVLEGIGTLLM